MNHIIPESKTRALAVLIAETIATVLTPVKVFRLWHPQAPAEPVACVIHD